MFVYNYTARCLVSQSNAALPCLTQRVEHLALFQVLYTVANFAKWRKWSNLSTYLKSPGISYFSTFLHKVNVRCYFNNVDFLNYIEIFSIHAPPKWLNFGIFRPKHRWKKGQIPAAFWPPFKNETFEFSKYESFIKFIMPNTQLWWKF